MKRYFLILSLILLTSCNFGDEEPSEIMDDAKNPSEEITTYYFIRHAEKDTTDTSNKNPELTETGKKRAQNWTKTFKDIDILANDSIYVFVETTINFSTVTDPLHTDKVLFDNGNNQQNVYLVTLVQDANFIFPKKIV